MLQANKERLGVLLAETRDKSTSEERYRCAARLLCARRQRQC